MDSQQVNSGTPEVSAPYAISADMTPEAAGQRAKELVADRDFAQRLYKGGKDCRESRELDALQRRATGHETQPAAPVATRTQAPAPTTTQPSAELTPEQATARLAELRSDEIWRAKFSRGDSAARREFDRLTEIAAGTYDNKALTEAELREARAAALDTVPEKPEDYKIDWRAISREPVAPEGVKAMTTWAHEIGLTQSEMTTVVEFGARDLERFAKMTAAQRETHAVEMIKTFGRNHGDDAQALYNGALDLVEQMCGRDPMFKRFVYETGIIDSPAFIEAMAVAALQRSGNG